MSTSLSHDDIQLEVLDDDLFIADAIDGLATKPCLRTLGTGATQACVGDDARLSDDRTASGLRTDTTVVDIAGATAPTTGQVLTAIDDVSAEWTTLSIPELIYWGDNEVPSGVKNGLNKIFTLANTPTLGSQHVYKNGLRFTPTLDYTISGGTITFVKAPKVNDTLIVDYRH